MTKFLYAHSTGKNGCYQHRVQWPFKWLAKEFPNLDLDVSTNNPIGNYSYTLTHGVPPLGNFLYIGKWKRSGSKWILSIDDDYTSVPEWSPATMTEESKDLFANCYDLADVILTSTEALAEAVDRPEKTVVAPNLMQVADYDVVVPAPTIPGEKLRIMWAGSATHAGDFVDAEPAIEQLLRKYKDKIEFIFMGYCPGKLLRDYGNEGVVFEQGCSLNLYPKVLNKIRPHIVIAPLADIQFNACKSNIRVLEGWSLAAPVVASAVGEYKAVSHGVEGYLAKTTEEWFHYLDLLIQKQELREHLGYNGRKRVKDFDWAVAENRQPWRDFIYQLQSNVNNRRWKNGRDYSDGL